MKKGIILLVEDEQNNRELLAAIARDLGHEVIAVDSGEKALTVLAEKPVDLIITDFHLGPDGINGVHLLKEARRRYVLTRSILTTGDVTGAYRECGRDTLDLKAILPKPWSLREAEEAIRNAFS